MHPYNPGSVQVGCAFGTFIGLYQFNVDPLQLITYSAVLQLAVCSLCKVGGCATSTLPVKRSTLAPPWLESDLLSTLEP